MSTLVDERVVEMKFDNRDFERNTRQSMSTIAKLKASLNFSGVASSVNQSVSSIDMNPLIAGLEKTEKAFSTWEVAAITAISNITNRLVDLGINLAKSLSVDNITSGWEQFGELTRNTGTMINQLVAKGYSEEAALNAVNESMDQFMWYSDATSFKLEQMTAAADLFVQNGKKLEDVAEILFGIGNLGASAGKNAAETSEMYQIASKIGDRVMTQQYESLRRAGFITEDFKKKLLDLATEQGVLTKFTDTFTNEVIYYYEDMEITAENMRESISKGWLTGDIFFNAVKQYGNAVGDIYKYNKEVNELAENTDGTIDASTAIEQFNVELDKEIKSTKELIESLKELGDTEALTNAQTKLAELESKKVSVGWTKAATEARTFAEAVDAVKDAVKTEWSRIFTTVIGDYKKATEIWTTFSNRLYDIFAGPLYNIRQLVEANGEVIQKSLFGGISDEDVANSVPLGAIWNLINAVESFINIIKEAWHEVFPIKKSFGEIAESIRLFTLRLQMSEEVAGSIKSIFKGFFSLFKIGIKILQGVKTALDPIFKAIIGDSGNLLKFLGKIGDKIYDWANDTTIFTRIGEKFARVFTTIIDAFKEVKIIEYITTTFKKFFEEVSSSIDFKKALLTLKDTAKMVFEFFLKALSGIIRFVGGTVLPAIVKAIPYLLKFIGLLGHAMSIAINWLIKSIGKFFNFIKSNETIQNGWIKFMEFMKSVPDRLKSLQPFFIKLGNALKDFFSAVWDGMKKIGETIAHLFKLNTIGELFVMIGNKIAYGFQRIIEGIKSLSSSDTSGAVSAIKEKMSPLEPLIKGLIDLFKGLWSVFKALIPVIGAVLSAVGNLLTQISNSLTKTFKTKVGDGGFNLWYLINGGFALLIAKGLYDFVYLFNGVTSAIANTIDALGSVMRAKAVMAWASAIKTVALAILMMVGAILIITLIDENKLQSAVKTLVSIMATMALIITIMGKFLKTSYSQVTTFPSFGKGKGFIGGSLDSSGDGFFGVAGMILAFGLSVLALVAALKVIDSIDTDKMMYDLGVLALIMGMLALSIGIMNAVANIGNQAKNGVKGIKGVLAFSLAILIMTIPLKKIGDMDIEKLRQALFAIASLMLAYALAVKIANGIKAKSFSKVAVMAAGLVAMVGPIQMLAAMDPAQMWIGVGAVSTMMFMFGALAAMASDFKMGNAIGLIAMIYVFGLVIQSLATLISDSISKISWDSMGKFGIIAGSVFAFLTLLMVGIGVFKKKAKQAFSKSDSKDLLKKIAIISVILLAVAGVAVALMYANKIVNQVNWASFATGIGMFVVVIAATFAVMKYAEKVYIDATMVKNITAIALVLSALSIVMLSIGKLAKDLSGLGDKAPQTIALVLGSLVLVLAAIIGLTSLVKGSSVEALRTIAGISVLFLALSAMMVSLAAAVKAMGAADARTLQATILIIAGSLVAAFALFAVAALFKDKIMDCAKAMIVLASSMAIFAVGALAFAKAAELMKGNVLGIVLVAGAMVALAVAAKLLGGASPSLLQIAVAFAAMGIAVLAVGASIYLIIMALEKMLPMLDELATKGEQLKTVLSSSIQGIVEGIANALPVLTTQIMTSLDILLGWIWEKLGEFVNKFLDLDVKKFKAVIDKLVELLFIVVMSILEGLDKNIGKIVDKLVSIILGAVYALIARLPEIAQALFDLVIGLIDSFGEALANNAARLRDSIVNFAKNMWQAFLNFFGIHSPSKESESAAGNIIAGLVQGLAKGVGKVINELLKLGSKMLKEVLKLPKKFIKAGTDILKSFFQGLKSTANIVLDFLSWLKDKVLDFFTFGLYSKVKDAGKQVMVQYQNGMETVNDDVSSTAKEVVKQTVEELSKTEYFKTIGEEIVENIINGIDEMTYELSSALSDMLYNAVDELEYSMSDLEDAMGGSAIDKFVDSFENIVYGGLTTAFNALNDTVFTPLNESISGAIKIFKSATPDIGNECKKIASIVKSFGNIGEAGENALVKYTNDLSNRMVADINGMSSALSTCMDSLTQVVELKWYAINKALYEGHDWLTDALADLKDLIDAELDFTDEELTIRPVMDISDIEEKTGKIAGMLYSVGNISVASASINAEKASSEIAATKQMNEAASSTTTQVTSTGEQGEVYNVTFNITGNDPKAIADEVSKRFQQYTSRRNTAYGRGNI